MFLPACVASHVGQSVRQAIYIALLALMSLTASAENAKTSSSRVPQPAIEPARGGQCVEDTAYMRRNHMNLLKHQRDDTLRGGIRTGKNSLKACIECHASKTTGSVNASNNNFCQSCHNYTAVKIDCFECHANKPEQKSFHPLVSHGSPGETSTTMKLKQLLVQQQVKP